MLAETTLSRPAPVAPIGGGLGWSAAERAELRAEVAVAARILAPQWPIGNFIAVNPLGGLEHLPFERALTVAGESLGARGTLDERLFREAAAAGRVSERDLREAIRRHLEGASDHDGPDPDASEQSLLEELLHGAAPERPARTALTHAERTDPALAARIDGEVAKWCSAFLDEGSAWPMPGREKGFYAAWRALAPLDPGLPKEARRRLGLLPVLPDEAILGALARLGVDSAGRGDYLRAHLGRMPGWAGHVRWRGERGGGIDLVGYLAARLALEAALLATKPDPAPPAPTEEPRRIDSIDRGMIWLEAYEAPYRRRLLGALGRGHERGTARPAVQLVCCIDVRSEGLRRHLEARGAYETLGFAGFFAVAIRYRDLAGGAPADLCPVLVSPQAEIAERPTPGAEDAARHRIDGLQTLRGADEGFHHAKEEALSPFSLAEAGGWIAGPLAAARTLAPDLTGRLLDRLGRRVAPPAPTEISAASGFDLDERVALAGLSLRMMGLVEGFGRLVVLCGHGSRTENNPYESALACGACGGAPGGPNARTAAAIFNDPEVRRRLAEEARIEIPADTWFLAAEHDTTTDRVELLDLHLAPADHGEDVRRLESDLREAGDANRRERERTLPRATLRRPAGGSSPGRDRDWAQVFPEWGLAGNAAFLVAPREVSTGLDLGRRVFLHSYRASADPDGSALETILTAPLIVAQWINCQYYFSTVDPLVFGAGTKTIHNVVSGVGVLAGGGGDLQPGLPWQSVADGDGLVHEPMRLLAAVQAPLGRIDEIIARHRVLADLFGNGWVTLAAREHDHDGWQVRQRDGRWTAADEEEEEG